MDQEKGTSTIEVSADDKSQGDHDGVVGFLASHGYKGKEKHPSQKPDHVSPLKAEEKPDKDKDKEKDKDKPEKPAEPAPAPSAQQFQATKR